MLFRKGPLFYAFFNIRLWIYLMFKRKDLLWANDLDTLPANFLVSRLTGCPLVYDMHEYFTQVPELIGRKLTRRIWSSIESYMVPKLSYIITASESIARDYESRYSIPVTVIRNLSKPFLSQGQNEARFRFPDGKIILYQGTLNKNRGLEPMIRAMVHIHQAKMVIVGDGPERKNLVKLRDDLGLDQRVVMIPKLLPYQLQQLTPHADIGLSIEENRGLNYRYALPNKLFDYIYAGVPVLVSPLPEMQRIVAMYGVGWILESFDPEHISRQVNAILTELDRERTRLKQNLERASQELSWENEEMKLLEFLDTIE